MSDLPQAPSASAPVRDPLHGVTLEAMVQELIDHFGWIGLAEKIPVRCFSLNPSVPSSLKLLRKTPWARVKVQSLFLNIRREQRHQAR